MVLLDINGILFVFCPDRLYSITLPSRMTCTSTKGEHCIEYTEEVNADRRFKQKTCTAH